uniref:TASOR pseudo-PARP domain-containing protein n=1 Tax=Neogobius melanostomus TaxID=47308 RepID=A0A8C6TNS8_9GOBI
MGDSLAQREAPPGARGPQRRESYGGAQNPQKSDDDDVSFVKSYRGAQEKMSGESARIADRRLSSPPQVVHQRHMPVGTQKFHIPRKTKEKLALFQPLSSESREYEDMLTILTSGYLDPASSGCFVYSNPRLVHSETPEKEYVEKRKELKADGRTEKELEESYCFMSVDSYRLQTLCEKGLFIGQSRLTVLGNPQKGVYLSRCSDLLQMNPLTPGAAGEIIIFKVIKGKVKSIYENMKNLLDPTPRFDSHLSKNISKVTSVMSYRAFELTQHYFYEYSFDELRQRPRQVCPYAVVSFQFKGKDTPLVSKPMAPLRSNSQSLEKSQEFTVWSGDMVIDDRVLFQVSLRSSSPPFLPLKLPEKLDIKCVMRWSQATRRLPQSLFSYDLYNNSSKEVEKDGFHCSLLEVVDRSRSMLSVTKLLQELESKAVVMVAPLTEKGFLFLLSSVQMASTHERGENWRRSLHALFVFPESRCTKPIPQSVCPEPSPDSVSADKVMPGLNHFVPALHFALGKARTNPPPDLSTGVEQHAREYINGIKEGVLRPYPMGKYEPELEQAGRQYPVPKLHRLGLDTCLRPYLCAPAPHLLQLSRVRALVQSLCERLNQARPSQRQEPQRMHLQADQKMQQLIDLVLSCKRNAEMEVESELRSGAKRKRLEQETAQRAIKHLKAAQELQRLNEQQQDATDLASPSSLTSLIGSVGLKDTDLQDDGSELASKLFSLLNNLNQKATSQPPEPEPKESSPFDQLAIKLGLPTNCDIDLRRQEDFEGGSVSSQEGGFSPSGDPRPPRDRDPRRRPKTTPAPEVYEEAPLQPDIPWILIPITGLTQVRHSRKDADIPRTLVSITWSPQSQRHLHPLSPARRPPSPSPRKHYPRRPPPPSPRRSPPPSPRKHYPHRPPHPSPWKQLLLLLRDRPPRPPLQTPALRPLHPSALARSQLAPVPLPLP